MRRGFSLIYMLIFTALLFAAETETLAINPEYSGEAISEASNASAQFKFDLTDYMRAVIGFKKTEESADFLTDGNIELKPAEGITAKADVALAWDIITANNNVTIRLKADGKIRAVNNANKLTLDWKVTSDNGTKTYFDTSEDSTEITSDNSGEEDIVDIGFESGKGRYVDSTTLTIATESYADLSFDSDYFANLIVEITT